MCNRPDHRGLESANIPLSHFTLKARLIIVRHKSSEINANFRVVISVWRFNNQTLRQQLHKYGGKYSMGLAWRSFRFTVGLKSGKTSDNEPRAAKTFWRFPFTSNFVSFISSTGLINDYPVGWFRASPLSSWINISTEKSALSSHDITATRGRIQRANKIISAHFLLL